MPGQGAACRLVGDSSRGSVTGGGDTVPKASADRRAHPALTTHLTLQAPLTHLCAHPRILPPATHPPSLLPTGPSTASSSLSSTSASL